MESWLLNDCRQYLDGKTLVIDCPSLDIANQLAANFDQLADLPTPANRIRISCMGKTLYGTFPTQQSRTFNFMFNAAQDVSFQRMLDEIDQHELPVCLTDHNSHRCVYLNGRFTPERIILSRDEYCRNGLNFLWYWRDSMDDLQTLLRELNQNGKLKNFKYQMRRPDGAMCWYVMDYELTEMFGILVRKSISHDWGIVSQAPDLN
jgi:hypothetical protein